MRIDEDGNTDEWDGTVEGACIVLGHMPEPVIVHDIVGDEVMQVQCARCKQVVVGYE